MLCMRFGTMPIIWLVYSSDTVPYQRGIRRTRKHSWKIIIICVIWFPRNQFFFLKDEFVVVRVIDYDINAIYAIARHQKTCSQSRMIILSHIYLHPNCFLYKTSFYLFLFFSGLLSNSFTYNTYHALYVGNILKKVIVMT